MEEQENGDPRKGLQSRLWLYVALVVACFVAATLDWQDWIPGLALPAAFGLGLLQRDFRGRLQPWERVVVIVSACALWGLVLVGALQDGLWASALFMIALTALGMVTHRLVTRVDRRLFGMRYRRAEHALK